MLIPRKSSVFLWVLAPLTLVLSVVRPPNPRSDRSARVPENIGAFTQVKTRRVTANHIRLLGTRDIALREFVDADNNTVFLTAVFHDSNWKSLHPPHMCIRGSNFIIDADEPVETPPLDDGRQLTIGRLRATSRHKRGKGRAYVSLYAFVGQDFVTPSYIGFYFQHAPRALFRQATSGFLVRVESYVGRDGVTAAEKRCWQFFKSFLPVGEALIHQQ